MKRRLLFGLVVLALLATTCDNPFLQKKGGAPENPYIPEYAIVIDMRGNKTGDAVTASPQTGDEGDTITLNYTVANTAHYNLLDFDGVITPIASVDSAGNGTRTYTVNAADASNGEIVIIAEFEHTDLTPDPIAFADTSPHITITNGKTFTNAVTNAHNGSGEITYTSSDETVATVDGAGEVTAHKIGTAVITAEKAADEEYAHAEKSYTLEVVFMEMVRINGGTFTMGQTGVATPHEVTLTQGFYMGKYQVTQAQYEAVTGMNPSYFTTANGRAPADGESDAMRPVEYVTWYDAVEFCNKLSAMEGLEPVYAISGRSPASGYPITSAAVTADWSRNGYRLPTEAQWEYACRAGTKTVWYTGDSEDAALQAAAWYTVNAASRTHEVGLKMPNAWGLYDMHGNVYEWCWDWYGSYSSGAQSDPVGASSGTGRVLRGGGWSNSASNLRSAIRYSSYPSNRRDYIGFRILRP